MTPDRKKFDLGLLWYAITLVLMAVSCPKWEVGVVIVLAFLSGWLFFEQLFIPVAQEAVRRGQDQGSAMEREEWIRLALAASERPADCNWLRVIEMVKRHGWDTQAWDAELKARMSPKGEQNQQT